MRKNSDKVTFQLRHRSRHFCMHLSFNSKAREQTIPKGSMDSGKVIYCYQLDVNSVHQQEVERAVFLYQR